ncbi:hypothetical protein Y032_0417g1098 [Ancylostoma ceylanicum]|uniref:Uncharacterized protein n=1 Tax=Ancylostoma ceylanicum TaxID=53326 RepID=A0A016X1H2_9BILA|nr:hypothetical protein Y032_0417g1098 [Ancylostoma ceylanicum]
MAASRRAELMILQSRSIFLAIISLSFLGVDLEEHSQSGIIEKPGSLESRTVRTQIPSNIRNYSIVREKAESISE